MTRERNGCWAELWKTTGSSHRRSTNSKPRKIWTLRTLKSEYRLERHSYGPDATRKLLQHSKMRSHYSRRATRLLPHILDWGEQRSAKNNSTKACLSSRLIYKWSRVMPASES